MLHLIDASGDFQFRTTKSYSGIPANTTLRLIVEEEDEGKAEKDSDGITYSDIFRAACIVFEMDRPSALLRESYLTEVLLYHTHFHLKISAIHHNVSLLIVSS